MEPLRGIVLCVGMAWAGAFFSPTCLAEGPTPAGEVSPSIGDCQRPDFFLLNVEAFPEEVEAGQMPGCRFSAFRYLPDRQYHPSTIDELIASLRPGVPICFFVHGAFVSWEFAARKSPDHYRHIVHGGGHRPLHFIAVHWPSETNLVPCPAASLNQMERRANAIGMCLARFLSQVPAENPVCMLGHSYGARVICVMLQALSRRHVVEPITAETGRRRRIRVVFTAGAIDHHRLNPGQELDHAIHRVECLLNFTNCLDPAMQAYAFTEPLLTQPLGHVGFTCLDRIKLGGQAEKITRRDVTLAVGCGHVADKYFSRPEVMTPMIPYIFFD